MHEKKKGTLAQDFEELDGEDKKKTANNNDREWQWSDFHMLMYNSFDY